MLQANGLVFETAVALGCRDLVKVFSGEVDMSWGLDYDKYPDEKLGPDLA